jgi:hypothetical protein
MNVVLNDRWPPLDVDKVVVDKVDVQDVVVVDVVKVL